MRSTVLRFGSVFAILALVLAACGGQTGQSEEPGARAIPPPARRRGERR